jgi:hypothetical protein
MPTMEKQQIGVEKAIEIAKVHFEKIKGADVQVVGRKLIDWLDFDVISTKEEADNFVITCEIMGNMFSKTKCSQNLKRSMR